MLDNLPDLIINAADLTKIGSNLRLNIEYGNLGEIINKGVSGRFYWSTDNILDTSDRAFRPTYIPPINPNSVFHSSFKLSARPRATDKFLIIQADFGNKLNESDELNNTYVVGLPSSIPDPLTRADLSISNLSLTTGTTVSQGYGFSPRYTLNNTGNAIAGTTLTNYVLSKDGILGNSDDIVPTKLNSSPLDQSLNSVSSRQESDDYLAIYDNLASGTYNLFVIADSTNLVEESNEANNTTSISVSFVANTKPDLIIESVTGNQLSSVGGYLNLNYRIKNIGLTAVGYSQIGFYLSNDGVFDSSDVLLDSRLATSSTGINIPTIRDRSIYLDPTKVTPGSYNLITRVDPFGQVPESNESNNNFILPITVNPLLRPDLMATEISNTAFNTGKLEAFSFNVSNLGSNSASSQAIFYLSTNATLDQGDINLGRYTVNALNQGQSSVNTYNLHINPNLVPIGSSQRYLIACVDGNNSIIESNEQNNSFAKEITINNTGVSEYRNTDGYGPIDVGQAIAKVLGVKSLPDVVNTDKNWGIDYIKAPEVWNAGYTGSGITVAVIDTGVDYNHPDLIDNIWVNQGEIDGNGIDDDGNGYIDDVRGWDYVDGDNIPSDTNGHGTHVAGIIAASKNSIGYTGVAYNAKIMPLKVIGGGDQWGNVKHAIRYAVDNGARVVNISLAGGTTDQDGRLSEGLQYAASKGVIVVMAAGNDGIANPAMPASNALFYGIAVGAITSTGFLSNYSNKAGTNPNMAYVTAPGSSVSTLPGNRYGKMQGTSMATPHVAGVVALMLSANPNLTDADIRMLIAG